MKNQTSNISYNSQRIPSLMVKQQFEKQIDQMKNQVFTNFKITKCQTHLLQKQMICLDRKCKFTNQPICKDCSKCTHVLTNVNKIVPALNQWVFRENQQITQQNKKLNEQWRVVSQNITYCIEIFQQLLKIIQTHMEKKIYAPKKFIDITSIVFGMFSHDSNNQSVQMFLKNWVNLQKKYHILQNLKQNQNLQNENLLWKSINCQSLQIQKKQRLRHAVEANKKSKQFSQKALAFSQTLASLIQSKVKEEQIKNKIKQIKIKNQLTLKDLLQQINSAKDIQESKIDTQSMFERIETFSLQLYNKDTLKDLLTENLEQSLGKMKNLRNLKELRINNKNGKIDHKTWYHIINYVQMLKFLKDLKLSMSQKDLVFLTRLFKQKQKSVRQIQSLTLQISDQKQLNLQEVNDFLNTLQLRRLNLILTRDNLEGKKILQFVKKLKIYTSLSQLPLIQCNVNFSANKVHNDEKIQVQKTFIQKCKDVKMKSISL